MHVKRHPCLLAYIHVNRQAYQKRPWPRMGGGVLKVFAPIKTMFDGAASSLERKKQLRKLTTSMVSAKLGTNIFKD